ncbi:hypothetical protein ACFXKW_30475 [Streptomyces sp. NPDC059193]|uniref:hypothetical protein n=1 Tax=Streptomyces sp. NPDC059193 TaxID=3346763 RepID=UPI00367D9268
MARNPRIDRRAIDKLMKDIAKDFQRASRKHPIRVPVSAEATAAGGVLNGGEALESSTYLARLLMWLDAHAQQHPGEYVDVTRFVEEYQLPGEDASVLALQLEQRGLVNIARSLADATDVHLTDEGRIAVHQLKNLQRDRAARLRHTMDAFLRWLFDTEGHQVPVHPALFLATPGSFFAGAEISGTELHQALAYLAEHDLVEPVDTDPVTIAITPQGVSCALSGGSVQDHTNQPRSGATYNNFLPNAQGVIIGEQQNFTQSNTGGIDPSAFVQLAGYVGQISGTLGLAEPERTELERVAQELHDEATSQEPQPGRLRQLAGRIKEGLLEAGSTMAATVGIQMAEQAIGALMQ